MEDLLSLKKGGVYRLIAHTILHTPLPEVKKKQSRQTRNPKTVTRQKATTKVTTKVTTKAITEDTMKDIRPREVILKREAISIAAAKDRCLLPSLLPFVTAVQVASSGT
jgi:hypothetical protein